MLELRYAVTKRGRVDRPCECIFKTKTGCNCGKSQRDMVVLGWQELTTIQLGKQVRGILWLYLSSMRRSAFWILKEKRMRKAEIKQQSFQLLSWKLSEM